MRKIMYKFILAMCNCNEYMKRFYKEAQWQMISIYSVGGWFLHEIKNILLIVQRVE